MIERNDTETTKEEAPATNEIVVADISPVELETYEKAAALHKDGKTAEAVDLVRENLGEDKAKEVEGLIALQDSESAAVEVEEPVEV